MAARSAVGLDIGTSGVRAAQVSTRKGALTLERFGQVALPFGAVHAGEMADPDAVAYALKELWSGTGFTSKDVVLGVSNGKVIVRQVDLPWLPIQELRESLRFQVQDFLPMDVNDALLDLHPLMEFTDADGNRKLRGLLVAASREMVLGLLGAVAKAGLRATGVDLTSFAVLRAVGHVDHVGTGDRVEALVDVGASVTNIIIHVNGVPSFVRLLLMGGGHITETIADRLGVSVSEAEAIKQAYDPAQAASSFDKDPAVRAIESATATFVDEIRGSLDYYASSSAENQAIDRIVLTGGGARLLGLPERLTAITHLPVEPGRGFQSVSFGRTGLTDAQLDFVAPLAAVPVGLALGAMS